MLYSLASLLLFVFFIYICFFIYGIHIYQLHTQTNWNAYVKALLETIFNRRNSVLINSSVSRRDAAKAIKYLKLHNVHKVKEVNGIRVKRAIPLLPIFQMRVLKKYFENGDDPSGMLICFLKESLERLKQEVDKLKLHSFEKVRITDYLAVWEKLCQIDAKNHFKLFFSVEEEIFITHARYLQGNKTQIPQNLLGALLKRYDELGKIKVNYNINSALEVGQAALNVLGITDPVSKFAHQLRYPDDRIAKSAKNFLENLKF